MDVVVNGARRSLEPAAFRALFGEHSDRFFARIAALPPRSAYVEGVVIPYVEGAEARPEWHSPRTGVIPHMRAYRELMAPFEEAITRQLPLLRQFTDFGRLRAASSDNQMFAQDVVDDIMAYLVLRERYGDLVALNGLFIRKGKGRIPPMIARDLVPEPRMIETSIQNLDRMRAAASDEVEVLAIANAILDVQSTDQGRNQEGISFEGNPGGTGPEMGL